MAQPGATLIKTAETLGVSRSTLIRDLNLVDQDALNQSVKSYRKILDAELPLAARVTKLVKVTDSDNPFAVLKALHRADAISGLHCEPPRDQQHHAEPVPLFSLPAGTRVAIQVGKPDQD